MGHARLMTSAYFYCERPRGADAAAYQHLSVCLAEGLRELGIPSFGNIDYWPLDADRREHLIRHDPSVAPHDCSVILVNDDYLVAGNPVPAAVGEARGRIPRVLLDKQDGSRLVSLRSDVNVFDLVLRTHYNVDTRYADGSVPWAFGLSSRLMRTAAYATSWPLRGRRMLVNWRHTGNRHSVRNAVERRVLAQLRSVLEIDSAWEQLDALPADPYDRVLWEATGRRHWPAYYHRLGAATASACFSGYFVTRWPKDKSSTISRVLKRLITLARLDSRIVSQFDSWRFWESLNLGTAAIHVDFERYGCVLPVMPKAWEHYVGIDLDDVTGAVRRIADDRGLLERIASAGARFAREHYAPQATARRFLDLLGITVQGVVDAPGWAARANSW